MLVSGWAGTFAAENVRLDKFPVEVAAVVKGERQCSIFFLGNAAILLLNLYQGHWSKISHFLMFNFLGWRLNAGLLLAVAVAVPHLCVVVHRLGSGLGEGHQAHPR